MRPNWMHWQAVVISYEGAGQDTYSTYLAEKLAPLQPIVLWGRTAAQMPSVRKEHAVYYWWKESGQFKVLNPKQDVSTGGVDLLFFPMDFRLVSPARHIAILSPGL